MSESSPTPATDASPEAGSGARSQLHTVVFTVMLALALGAMALTMSKSQGTTALWGVLLLVYAGVSITWDWQRARARGEPATRMIRLQLLHWGAVLVGLLVLLLFERSGILSREAASTVALLVLAMGCLLAGVHFDWSFLLLGAVLAVMTVAIGYLEQYLVWLVMLPVLVGVAWLYFYLRTGSRRKAEDGGRDTPTT